MIYLDKEDYYEVYLESIVSDYDRDTLTMLYQPLVGADAISLYLTLYSQYKRNKSKSVLFTYEELMITTGFSLGDIDSNRKKLEAIGLIKTYYKKEKTQAFYKYLIYAPKTPKDFFDDILFKGLLISRIGERKVQALIREYKIKELDLSGYNEISESFNNVFNPDLNSSIYNDALNINGGYGRATIDISKGFDISKLINVLQNTYMISKDALKKKDLNKISEMALLYGVSEDVMADYLSQSFNPEKTSFDFEKLKQLSINEKTYRAIRNQTDSIIPFDSESPLGKKIKQMSETSALDYLKLKQKNGAVSPSDIKLITDLNEKYGLSSKVINPLIDWCLERDNSLNKNYVTKIAAALVREGLTDTLDTMNYLMKSSRRRNSNDRIEENNNNKNKEINTKDEENLDDLLEGL